MLREDNFKKLEALANELFRSDPEKGDRLHRLIYSMVNKRDGAKFKISSLLERGIQDYYQLKIDSSGFNHSHWISTLKGCLQQITKLNEAPKIRDGFYLTNQELDLLVKDVNPEFGGPFNEALDHLELDGSEAYWYENFYKKELSLKDLFLEGGLDLPNYQRKYPKE